MKKQFYLIILFLFYFSISAQDQYKINGEIYELKTEVSGTIDLLWNIIDKEFRYFVRKNDIITELVNTKGDDKKYQDEYIKTLGSLTKESNLDTNKVNLTLYSLGNFINIYNASVDPNYQIISKEAIIKTRLLFFGGVTNSPLVNNPDNISTPVFGMEIEVFEGIFFPRHSLFLEVKHVLNNAKFDYTTTQIALGYRFRMVKSETFNIYTNVVFGTYNFSKNRLTFINEGDEDIFEENSVNDFDVPFSFGIGADVKITANGFITFNYNELFALFLDNKGNFSTNITLGYKINL
jgi:hypothetical protein